MDFKSLREKAKAFASKSQQNDTSNKPKPVRKKIDKKLPEIKPNQPVQEDVIREYMDTLRETHAVIGQHLLKERIQKKKEKKFKNVNYIKNETNKKKNENSLRRKIKEMRKQRIFPQPKSYTNYNKRNGLIKKNSIKIEN